MKFSTEWINDPALESPVATGLGIIAGVEVVEPLTAKITLSKPHAGLSIPLYDYRLVMLPSESGDTIAGIRTGPSKLDGFDPESTTKVVANPDYLGGAPKPDRISIAAIPDAEARNQEMLAGLIDLNALSQDQVPP